MCSNGFSEIRRDMDCGYEVGNLIEEMWDSDGPVALYLEAQELKNQKIVRRLEEIGAPAELIEEVREGTTQNANTVLYLIDEARRVYPEYRLYPQERVERMVLILDLICRAGGPMVEGLIRDLFRDCPMGADYHKKDGKDYREKQGRP